MQKLRRGEIDLTRFIPMLFWPLVHCYEEFEFSGMLTESAISAGRFLLFLCAFGPSVFTLILGMNISFSSSATPKKLAKRALITAIIFVALNFIRCPLLMLVGNIFLKLPDVNEIALSYILESDILGLASISFLYFSLMKKFNVKPFYGMLFSFILLAIGTTIKLDMPSNLWTGFLGNFVRVNPSSCFPALSWLVYPSVGYYIGDKVQSFENETDIKKYYISLTAVGATILITLGLALYTYGENPLITAAAVVRDNTTDVFNALLDLGIAFVWLGIAYAIWQLIKSDKVKNTIIKYSKALTVFYIIHWIFVGWTEVILEPFIMEKYCVPFWMILILAVVITIVTLIIAIPLQKKLDAEKVR